MIDPVLQIRHDNQWSILNLEFGVLLPVWRGYIWIVYLATEVSSTFKPCNFDISAILPRQLINFLPSDNKTRTTRLPRI